MSSLLTQLSATASAVFAIAAVALTTLAMGAHKKHGANPRALAAVAGGAVATLALWIIGATALGFLAWAVAAAAAFQAYRDPDGPWIPDAIRDAFQDARDPPPPEDRGGV